MNDDEFFDALELGLDQLEADEEAQRLKDDLLSKTRVGGGMLLDHGCSSYACMHASASRSGQRAGHGTERW
jgi:hypothetical protein